MQHESEGNTLDREFKPLQRGRMARCLGVRAMNQLTLPLTLFRELVRLER